MTNDATTPASRPAQPCAAPIGHLRETAFTAAAPSLDTANGLGRKLQPSPKYHFRQTGGAGLDPYLRDKHCN